MSKCCTCTLRRVKCAASLDSHEAPRWRSLAVWAGETEVVREFSGTVADQIGDRGGVVGAGGQHPLAETADRQRRRHVAAVIEDRRTDGSDARGDGVVADDEARVPDLLEFGIERRTGDVMTEVFGQRRDRGVLVPPLAVLEGQ